MKKQNKDRDEFNQKIFGIIVDYVHDDLFNKDTCVKSIDKLYDWIETYTQKKVEDEREKVLEEVREIIKNKSGIPIFFKKEDDMSENNPHFKAICYYLNQLRQELLSEINNLKNNDSKGANFS